MSTPIYTADICDHCNTVKVLDPIFQHYGAKTEFHGQIHTVKVYEDNVLVKNALSEPGAGKVLVVDGGASMRCALIGDVLADIAIQNEWAGILVYGCIRDSAKINTMPIGIKALNTHPLKSVKHGHGDQNIPVTFASVTFFPNHYLYADNDGVVVLETPYTP